MIDLLAESRLPILMRSRACNDKTGEIFARPLRNKVRLRVDRHCIHLPRNWGWR